jgi:outer membrane protein assembly factor BamB
MGSPVTTYLRQAGLTPDRGYLLGWDLRTRKLVLDKIVADGDYAALDGSPVADDSNLYVAMRLTDINPQAHVACYDLQSQRLRWQTKIASANTLANGMAEEVTHSLLTLDHGVIYFNTNLGAVAALSADDGKVRWITRYPRSSTQRAAGRSSEFVLPGLTPCLFHHGMLLVAPSDSDRVFALDANSGHRLWQTTLDDEPIGAVQLLGVADQHLIAGGRRLWWLDVTTGQLSRDVAANPYPVPGSRPPTGLGRGVVTPRRIYWPARSESVGIHVIDRRDGLLLQEPIPLDLPDYAGLNLIASKGYLVVTTSSRICAFRHSSALEK